MKRTLRLGMALLTAGLAIVVVSPPALALDNLFFLHHSTGRNLLVQGEVRLLISAFNSRNGSTFVLWDHDYNYLGLNDPLGLPTGRCYDIPNDNTDPVGLHELWTTANSARDSILANHQVIAFKSCFPASAITSDDMLAQYKTWYLEIRDELDRHPDHIFLVMSPPPLHPCQTILVDADRARAFADWLGSPAFLDGHANLRYFDFFAALAEPRDSPQRNTLRVEYRNTEDCLYADSHPNTVANVAVAPLFVDALLGAAASKVTAVPGGDLAADVLLPSVHPNPFNPATTIRFDLPAAGRVRLSVYDVAGRLVRTLVDNSLAEGPHEAVWDGRDASGRGVGAGSYFARLLAGGRRETVRMSLVR
ncbi:MAG: FlgD immunoglobulin-like domain containing protein [Candidatus Krumholzibacteriia bacterium]